ncbi:SOS response-associated peptidase [Hyphomicrobium sulfonivorans]|uniref:SOS response-associated peptidase n=1 Tax=Hyphomicrobium sulfonivorans TaxID=121290 RepID=UPI001FE2B695|nr:SOS response-associated peptidase [Hyphomicrobium sulfonivorans]
MALLLRLASDYLSAMCSRYSLTSPPEAVRAMFGYHNDAIFPPRYNIAPSQPVAIVRYNFKGEREMALVQWGLLPSWVKDPREFKPLINARAESAAAKPSFRAGLRHKRCLVPADGYYEWTGAVGDKQPHLIRPHRATGPIALAAIYEEWLGADGSEIETMAVLTVPAKGPVAALHNRMPVIIPPEHFELWLNCRSGTTTEIQPLLSPEPRRDLEIIDVSRKLNNPANEGPQVQEPIVAPGRLL